MYHPSDSASDILFRVEDEWAWSRYSNFSYVDSQLFRLLIAVDESNTCQNSIEVIPSA